MILRTNGKFAVYVPKQTTKKEIDDIVRKNYRKLTEIHQKRQNVLFSEDESDVRLPFFGKYYPLKADPSAKNALIFKDGVFLTADIDRERLTYLYREFLRKQTAEAVTRYAKDISDEFSFKYEKITVKAIYSRYGSCSGKGNLNFSLALAAFEPSFIRFVVCHELCHTVHLNHGKEFYALLDKVCPEHKSIKSNGSNERSALLKAILYRPA